MTHNHTIIYLFLLFLIILLLHEILLLHNKIYKKHNKWQTKNCKNKQIKIHEIVLKKNDYMRWKDDIFLYKTIVNMVYIYRGWKIKNFGIIFLYNKYMKVIYNFKNIQWDYTIWHNLIGWMNEMTWATKWLEVGLHATVVKERGRPSILFFFKCVMTWRSASINW